MDLGRWVTSGREPIGRFYPTYRLRSEVCSPAATTHFKNLNEANPDNFKFPRLLAFDREGENISGRQAAFYDHLLRIALACEGRSVPYAFRDAAGQSYRLDDGSIGRAISQSVLEEPQGDRDGIVQQVTITERYWHDRENDGSLERLRQQIHNLDGVGADLFEEFDPATVSVESVRRTVLAIRELRAGQPEFRRRLLGA